ncbi:3-oxoacyl-[acyl-carrier-protein] reductase FabG [subsurface metagenome]
MGKLDKRVALITGGGTGIGRGIALEFAKEGADVVIASRNMANLEKVVKEIKALGRRSLAITTDVRVKEQVQNMVKRAVDEFGRIDILVNNAGIIRRALIVDMTLEDWDDVIAADLTAVFLCIQAVAKQMMEQKYGKIINIASTSGGGAIIPTIANYCTAKAGVIQLTKCAGRELGSYGINVNAISPGLIKGGMYMSGRTPEQAKQVEEANIKAVVLGRIGTPEEIGKLVVYLASDDSSFMCGENIIIDGGRFDPR